MGAWKGYLSNTVHVHAGLAANWSGTEWILLSPGTPRRPPKRRATLPPRSVPNMDCIEDNVTTTIILPNLWCRPTTPHATHFGPFRAGWAKNLKKELNLNRSDSWIIDSMIKLTMSPDSLPPSVNTSMQSILGLSTLICRSLSLSLYI